MCHFSILASLNLPAAIENTSGDELPPSLLDKGDTLKRAGGLSALQATINELPELLQRNKDILDEVKYVTIVAGCSFYYLLIELINI